MTFEDTYSYSVMCINCKQSRGAHYSDVKGIHCPWKAPDGYNVKNSTGMVFSAGSSKAKTLSHECPCGIVRADCTYHKVT